MLFAFILKRHFVLCCTGVLVHCIAVSYVTEFRVGFFFQLTTGMSLSAGRVIINININSLRIGYQPYN